MLFCDLAGSIALAARLDSEDLREVIVAYHRAVAGAVRTKGGYVAKLLGDGVLAYFGWPEAHEDDAERAVGAGLAACVAVAGLETTAGPLAARVGIATGSVVVGEVLGEGEARERGVVGETPNLAARLQVLAEPGQVVADAATRRLTGALFEYSDLGDAELKGLPHPVRAWRALREGRIENRFEALRSGAAPPPLVGREEELELLLQRWRQARDGEGQVVLLGGEAGIGKSRLAAALRQTLADNAEEHERLDWFCAPQYRDSALQPVIAWLERAAAIASEDAPQAKLTKLRALLAPGDPTQEEVGLVADLLGLRAEGGGPSPDLDARQRRERTLAALLRRLEALAARRPVLGVLEDAHWADPTTIELLDLLLGRVAGLPVLLVVTHRPEFRAPWAGHAHVAALRLDRLGRRDSATLVGRVAAAAGAGAPPPEVVEEIVERTDGVPLFAEELTRTVLEAGYGAAGARAAPMVPATLHASLDARLDRLGPAARRVAQAGGAIGREFDHDLLAAAVDMPGHDLAPALRRLEDAGLVHRRGDPPEATYSFRHALLRDAAYGMLLRGQRRILHARVAEAFEELRPEAAEREPQVLAWHCAKAGLTDRAIALWRRAGERSASRYANLEAAEHVRRALEVLGELAPGERRDRLEAELRLAQAVPLIAAHGFGSEAVEACAARATELGDRFPGWPGAFIARRLAWNSCLLRREASRTVGLARGLLSAAEADGDPVRAAVGRRALGYSLFVAGELAEARGDLERGAALADGLADTAFAVYGEDPRIVCRIYLGKVRSLMGDPDAARRIAGEGLARARTSGNPHAVAWSLVVLSHTAALVHDAVEAERIATEAIDISQRHRFPQWLGLAQQWRGWALCRLGDVAGGVALLEEGLRRMRGTGAVLHTTIGRCLLADGCLLAGDPAAALGHLEAAQSHVEVYGERYLAAEIHRLLAEARRAGGEANPECEGHLREAQAIARGQGARLLELRAARDLARLRRDQGRAAEAHDLLAPVYAAFTEGFSFPDLIEARALLEDLRAAPADGADWRQEEVRTPQGPHRLREPAPDR